MAYANLAELDPIYGIYTAIFPVLIYTLLGPSRHVSMGEKKINNFTKKNTLRGALKLVKWIF